MAATLSHSRESNLPPTADCFDSARDSDSRLRLATHDSRHDAQPHNNDDAAPAILAAATSPYLIVFHFLSYCYQVLACHDG